MVMGLADWYTHSESELGVGCGPFQIYFLAKTGFQIWPVFQLLWFPLCLPIEGGNLKISCKFTDCISQGKKGRREARLGNGAGYLKPGLFRRISE